MKNLYKTMIELLQQGESFAVATIFDKSGSAPRTEGAKMVVRADGSIVGTIGGGRLEASAINLAREMIPTGKTVVQSFDLTSKDADASDMICGGSGEILLDFIDANDQNNLMIYKEAAEIIANGKKGWLITVLGKTVESMGIQCQRCLVKPDKTMIGSITCSSYLLEKLIAGPAKITIHSEAFDEHRFLVQPLRQGSTVYIFGAGHVSQKIAPLSESVGFRTIVMDDRADYANRERFPEPIEIKVIASFKELPVLDIDEHSYLVIVTRGHLFDKGVLEQVLRSKAAYIGMIGSRSKRDLIYDEMLSKGFTKEELGAVYSPIGTDIGAETPEELAVSIVGELVKVRSEKNGHKKKDKGSDSTPCCRIQTAPC
ncbi:MAG: XdhC family protein [Syntrophobacteraceae bacterium]|nr:XdhC family protein [Syntrophobacteraceae bacterium]